MKTSWDVGAGVDLNRFLDRPLVARLATISLGRPRVRPVWYLFDGDAFWWLTGPWSVVGREIDLVPAVELVVDTCELAEHQVIQVRARGHAEPRPFEKERARQWGERYLGPDRSTWGRFAAEVFDNPATTFLRMQPTWLRARDLSW